VEFVKRGRHVRGTILLSEQRALNSGHLPDPGYASLFGRDWSMVSESGPVGLQDPPLLGADGAPARTNRRHERAETAMASKNKGGREAKKPKQDQNKKQKGQAPSARSALDAIQGRADKK
jgi:hypothetical protein